MHDVDAALAFLRKQRDSGSTEWHNRCESLQRQAYGLPAHYSSANLHADAIPAGRRYGHEPPSRGDLVLMVNSTYGHIVTCEPSAAHPWSGWTNDYGGRGKVSRVADVRDLVRWCGATSWYVADAWWSSSNNLHTHEGAPAPTDPTDTPEDEPMYVFKTHQNDKPKGQGIGGGAHYVVSHGTAVQCEGGYKIEGDVPVVLSSSEAMDEAFYKSVRLLKL